MTTSQLLDVLSDRGVAVRLEGDRLRYRAPAGALTPDLRAAIVANRTEIVQQLRGSMEPAARERCRGICNRRDWRDEAPQDGRIRTSCGRCGKFIGFRPQSTENPATSDLRFAGKEGNCPPCPSAGRS